MKPSRTAGKYWILATLTAAASLTAMAGSPRGGGNDDNTSRIQRGKDIVPPGVTLNLTGKHRGMVWLGSYLVNTGGCIDCHSRPTYSPGGDPFLGQPERINAE